jgi:hypothetical protein
VRDQARVPGGGTLYLTDARASFLADDGVSLDYCLMMTVYDAEPLAHRVGRVRMAETAM